MALAREALAVDGVGEDTEVAVVPASADRTAYDRDAEFAEFMATRMQLLGRYAALLTTDPRHAEELLQATLVKTYLSWHNARSGNPTAYARRILINQRTDIWRRRHREVPLEAIAPEEPSQPDGTAALAERDRLYRALRLLPLRRRRIVVMRYLMDLTVVDVADDLGISVGTVKSTAARGICQLRSILADME